MSPSGPSRGKKMAAPDNLYTLLLASAFFLTLGTVIFVLVMCYTQYETLFKAAGR